MPSLAKKTFELLQREDRKYIFHANSVITSCHFLSSGALYSRGVIERKKLYQTPQSSDAIDRKYGIWFDVFANFVDIHDCANNVIFYGPIEFVIDVEILNSIYPSQLWVTKLNPIRWAGKSWDRRVFTSSEELERGFQLTDFDQMMMFRHCGGEITFRRFLNEIIIDDPDLSTEDGIDYYSLAYGAIRYAMDRGNIDVPITRRVCAPHSCKCRETYHRDVENTFRLFLPGQLSPSGPNDWHELL